MSKFIQQIREASAQDANYIYDLDLKCFDNPWSKENWAAISANSQAHAWVGCYRQVPISLVVTERQSFVPPDTRNRVQSLHIHKLCVKEIFRRKGVGARLLQFVHHRAVEKVAVGWVTMTVPEWLINTDEPTNCLGWLQKYKLKALATLPTKIALYGKDYDQYLFGYQLK